MGNRNVHLDSWDASGTKHRVTITGSPSSSRSYSGHQRRNNKSLSYYIWKTFSGRTGHNIVLGFFVVVVAVSYLMSTIPVEKTKEIDCMKKFLEVMELEVNRVEKSCMTAAQDVRLLQQYSTRNVATDTPFHPNDAKYIKHYPTSALLGEHFTLLSRLAIPQQSQGNSSTTEITIMSYIYTNSFDTVKNDTSRKK